MGACCFDKKEKKLGKLNGWRKVRGFGPFFSCLFIHACIRWCGVYLTHLTCRFRWIHVLCFEFFCSCTWGFNSSQKLRRCWVISDWSVMSGLLFWGFVWCTFFFKHIAIMFSTSSRCGFVKLVVVVVVVVVATWALGVAIGGVRLQYNRYCSRGPRLRNRAGRLRPSQ